MNTIIQILAKEDANSNKIFLYREGIFYKAYERSAYAFVTTVQQFMVKKKLVKCVGREVVSLGFPTDSIGSHFAKEAILETDNGVEIQLGSEIDIPAFEAWKQGIAMTARPQVRQQVVVPAIPQSASPAVSGDL